MRSIVAVVAAAFVAASVSGATEQPPSPIETAMPRSHFGDVASGPFSDASVRRRVRPLGPAAPPWARRLYRRSVRVLVALTDPRSGAMIAGERDGWDYVWPRDAGAGAIALQAAGLHEEARRVAGFLDRLDLDAARFRADGDRVPGRSTAGDAAGWVGAALAATGGTPDVAAEPWRDRQDYGENVTGDLLGNAIAARATAAEVLSRFDSPRGLVREQGGGRLDSAAAWAVVPFADRGLRVQARRTLLTMTQESTRFGIPPIEGWTPGEVWTAPTAWSAWALVELGETGAADQLLSALRRAASLDGTLPERVDARSGRPTSTTPLAWSHAFAILALRARYPSDQRHPIAGRDRP
jgi:hypothetical protein